MAICHSTCTNPLCAGQHLFVIVRSLKTIGKSIRCLAVDGRSLAVYNDAGNWAGSSTAFECAYFVLKLSEST